MTQDATVVLWAVAWRIDNEYRCRFFKERELAAAWAQQCGLSPLGLLNPGPVEVHVPATECDALMRCEVSTPAVLGGQ